MSNTITCIVVDDEPLAIEVIESYISQLESLEHRKSFQNPVKAFEYIQSHPVDLVFMDIQMPKLTGLDIIKSLPNCPAVILTTAYREYAIEGFDLEVVDYLLKPVAFDRFLKAIRKVTPKNVSQVKASDPSSGHSIFVKVDKRKVKVCPEKVLFMESQGDYLKMVMANQTIKTHMTISEAEEIFGAVGFIRIHRSFLINMQQIDSYGATEVVVGKMELPIGRNYRNEVLRILDNLAAT
jgi:DNA-binding LytR/AlgR family response regulator